MPQWAVWEVVGGGLVVAGAVLFYGWTRDWFTERWTYTVDNHVGYAILGTISGAVGLGLCGLGIALAA